MKSKGKLSTALFLSDLEGTGNLHWECITEVAKLKPF